MSEGRRVPKLAWRWQAIDYGHLLPLMAKLPYALGILIATPIAGLINNQIWNGALSRAAWQANSQLLADNDDIDVFLNPKYTFETRKGFFTQTAKIRFRVMGAKIITDSDKK